MRPGRAPQRRELVGQTEWRSGFLIFSLWGSGAAQGEVVDLQARELRRIRPCVKKPQLGPSRFLGKVSKLKCFNKQFVVVPMHFAADSTMCQVAAEDFI